MKLTLASSKGTDHDKTSGHTGEETGNTELTSHLDEPRGGRLAGGTLGLVDLRQEGVGGLRDNGGGQTGDKTGSKVKTSELSTSKGVLGLASGLENLLDGNLVATIVLAKYLTITQKDRLTRRTWPWYKEPA